MDRIMRARPSSSMVVALIALFVALVGTASAVDGPLPGQNQVGSADIINNEVQTADIKDANLTTVDIRSNAVTTGKIGDGEVRTADVLDDSLTPTDLADVGFLQSDTAQLNDQPGGGAASQQLFTIGRIRLIAVCQVLSNDRLLGSVQPVPTQQLNEDGPVMVIDGEGASDDFFVRLQDFRRAVRGLRLRRHGTRCPGDVLRDPPQGGHVGHRGRRGVRRSHNRGLRDERPGPRLSAETVPTGTARSPAPAPGRAPETGSSPRCRAGRRGRSR